MWHSATWHSGGSGNVRLMAELDDLEGRFQSE